MPTILRIDTGTRKGARITLRPGEELEVGRRGAGLALPEDTTMSGAHFAVSCESGVARLRDLGSSNGTFLNGNRVAAAVLCVNDRVTAGNTGFTVLSSELPWGDDAAPLDVLRSRSEPLYAILDAARDPEVLEQLRDSEDPFESLYDGASAAALADSAPYLVALASDGALLESLVEDGWGKSWGVYLTSNSPRADLRRHLRRFLVVDIGGRNAYFRFYDPRVLRIYLRSCQPANRAEFFGPVSAFYLEDEPPSRVMRFTPDPGR